MKLPSNRVRLAELFTAELDLEQLAVATRSPE